MEETHGFAVLPRSTALPVSSNDFLRPDELRRAAAQFLEAKQSTTESFQVHREHRDTLRIVTYNVHSCMGLDGRLSTRRIAEVLLQCDADVIALQELDARRPRSRMDEQAAELAKLLGMDVHFHPSLTVATEAYGDAILSKLPMRLVRAAALPACPILGRRSEPRGALWVEVEYNGARLQVFNTHLGLGKMERRHQVQALMGSEWLGDPRVDSPVILCGDFNAGPKSSEYQMIEARFRDSQKIVTGARPRSTWISLCPVLRIDHLFISSDFRVLNVNVPRTDLARVASDHLPLVVDLELTEISHYPTATGLEEIPANPLGSKAV
jgi:endonuclease/exonuclease/phosphatase family metal-dependent hydrolase